MWGAARCTVMPRIAHDERGYGSSGSSERYDLLEPANLENPYPLYHRMRAANPLYRDRRFLGHILTRYDDVAAILADPRVSARRPGADEPIGHRLAPVGAELRELRSFQAKWLLYADPPDHTRLRTLATVAFTPRRVEALRPRIQALVDVLLDGVRETGRMDVIGDLAQPLPTLVMAELMGLPSGDRHQLRAWSDGLAAGIVLSAVDASERFRKAHEGQRALVDYFRVLIAERRQRPREDLLSALLAAEAEGSILDEEELLATCVLLLFAGHETTTGLIGNGVMALLEQPGQLERLREEPALIGEAVEELLRYDSPIQATARRATVELELDGQRIRPGEFLTLIIGAANRDPARFDHPDVLDVARRDNRHLAFGYGPHFCLGAPLARLEGQIAMASLISELGVLELAGPVQRRPHFFLRSLESLPVAFKPAGRGKRNAGPALDGLPGR